MLRLFASDRLSARSSESVELAALRARVAALDRSYAVIEFTPSGQIVDANANFLAAVGYQREEIVGKHHSMFVDAHYRESAEYREFWARLGRGEAHAGQYRRFAKGGREIWIQATYDPVRDADGKLIGVVKHAADITAERNLQAAAQSRLQAIDRAQAVIEFTTDGHIVAANENFMAAVGYSAAEIVGQHHRMFVDPAYAASADYREFWASLARGESVAGRFERIAKGGRRIWIQAIYSPLRAPDGSIRGAIKYAQDITAQVQGERALATALERTGAVAEAVAAGQLGRRVSLDGLSGETRLLCESVNGLVETLDALVQQVQESSEQINTAAGEIAQGNTDLSSRTEQQASSLQETASSIEELTGTVKQNAENARQASELAGGASKVAVRGGEVVSQVVTTMAGIAEASKKIADIIGVIDGIAFQTNILALNAAVEAARAGEQGRGFAVVASEVRGLAQKSATAAKEIKALITDSVSRVDAGAALVKDAGATMHEIVSAVKRVTDIVAEITAASAEQASGIEQVNLAVGQMDQMTQQNAALVEEAAAAAESLSEQAQTLAGAVRRFGLDGAPAQDAWDGVTERRGPHRASNVARISRNVAPGRARAGTTNPAKAGPAKAEASAPATANAPMSAKADVPMPARADAPMQAKAAGDWEEF